MKPAHTLSILEVPAVEGVQALEIAATPISIKLGQPMRWKWLARIAELLTDLTRPTPPTVELLRQAKVGPIVFKTFGTEAVGIGQPCSVRIGLATVNAVAVVAEEPAAAAWPEKAHSQCDCPFCRGYRTGQADGRLLLRHHLLGIAVGEPA